MIPIMAYVALVSAGVAAAAVAWELVCRALRVPTRWGWVAGLGLTLAATVAVMLMPLPVRELPAALSTSAAPPAMGMREVQPPVIPRAVWEQAGLAATVAWVGASVVLLGLLGVGAATLMRERRMAGRSVVHGHDVLLTDGVGPAVAGLAKPVALIPRWVLEMDDASQRLLLAHEMEHVRARDSVVLVAGALVAALVPWNPLVWWMLRRLRLAVEVDCDRRVLAREMGVRRYAELLLMTARIPSEHAHLLVAGLGENQSDLERRIVVMTEKAPRRWLARAVVPAALAGVLVVVACETPRPDPVGPSALGLSRRPALAASDSALTASEQMGALKRVLEQFETLRDSLGMTAGEVPVSMMDTAPLFEAVRRLSGRIEFAEDSSARVRGRTPDGVLRFSELRKLSASRAPVRLEPENAELPLRSASDAPRMVFREERSRASYERNPEIVVLASDGRELTRGTSGERGMPALGRIDPKQIERVEVRKGSLCRDTPCSRITITLKPGATLRSR